MPCQVFNPFQLCPPISGLPSFFPIDEVSQGEGVSSKIAPMCLINWETCIIGSSYLEFIFNQSDVPFVNEGWLVSCWDRKTIRAPIYSEKLCWGHYLVWLNWWRRSHSRGMQTHLNLIHNVNYILQELLLWSYLCVYCLGLFIHAVIW